MWAQSEQWQVAEIGINCLWDPSALRRALGSQHRPEAASGSAQLGIPGVAKTEVKAIMARPTTEAILESGTGKLLLVLDEAQLLKELANESPDKRGPALIVLQRIHNGRFSRPVMLLAGGLGITRRVFDGLGISRFDEDCLVNLGPLSKKSTHAVVHDWLKKQARAKGDPTIWVEAIATETHGWPQHIISYVKPALNQIDKESRVMSTTGLAAVLENGRGRRNTYYANRSSRLEHIPLILLAKWLESVSPGIGRPKDEIVAIWANHYDRKEAERLFDIALHKGILDRRDGGYTTPIPSMHDWLVSEYADQELSAR